MRQATREAAVALGFSLVDQTKLVTAASELARNTLEHGGGGEVSSRKARDDGAKRGPADVRRPGPWHRRRQPGAQGWLHDGQRPGSRSWGRTRLSNEFEIDSSPVRARACAWCAGADLTRAMSSQLYLIEDRSQVGGARRAGSELAESLGFPANEMGKVALAVTEIATNILKHAGTGRLVLRALERDGVAGIEMLGSRPRSGDPRSRGEPARRPVERGQRRSGGWARCRDCPQRSTSIPSRGEARRCGSSSGRHRWRQAGSRRARSAWPSPARRSREMPGGCRSPRSR